MSIFLRLVEIGLALFLVTIIVNALAQLAGVDRNPRPACEGTMPETRCQRLSSTGHAAHQLASTRYRPLHDRRRGV